MFWEGWKIGPIEKAFNSRNCVKLHLVRARRSSTWSIFFLNKTEKETNL
jgi:hypothetical protein